MRILGMTEQRMYFSYTDPLKLNFANEKYLINIRQYVQISVKNGWIDRKSKSGPKPDSGLSGNPEETAAGLYGISIEENIALYSALCDALKKRTNGIEPGYLMSILRLYQDGAERFRKLSLPCQSYVLEQMLIPFSNNTIANLAMIGGRASGCRGTIPCKVRDGSRVYLVHESPGGIYEVRKDLM